jgi:DNA-binding transcriptional regulator GbsR (MarR family)
MKNELTAEAKVLVEKIGVHFEHIGIAPVAGRIMGLLMVASPPELSFEELQQQLSVSKSAISTGLALLMGKGMVSYHTEMGNRKRFFYLKTNSWMQSVHTHLDELQHFTHILGEVRELQPSTDTPIYQHLSEVISFQHFLHTEMRKLVVQWETTQKK